MPSLPCEEGGMQESHQCIGSNLQSQWYPHFAGRISVKVWKRGCCQTSKDNHRRIVSMSSKACGQAHHHFATDVRDGKRVIHHKHFPLNLIFEWEHVAHFA